MTPPLELAGPRLLVLDQTQLPHREVVLELDDADGVAAAIRRLSVRGAPLIGIAAAYGLALAVAHHPGTVAVQEAAARSRSARPTAVNLAWAVDRVLGEVLAAPVDARAAVARATAIAIHREEDAASVGMARHGADHLAGARRILTICNTGALAAGGDGTALAVIVELARRDAATSVIACETRPLLQGARLTVWELARHGIACTLIADGAAAGLMARGDVDAVITGCDRVAANGDVANKVGTYGLALAARAAGIPFVVVGPRSTVDPATPGGDAIEIEERAPDEVRYAGGALLTLPDVPVRNPAFDVTPATLVDALVTEAGVAAPPDRASIAALLAAE